MEGKALRSNEGSGEDLASLSPCKFEKSVPNSLLTGYLTWTQFMANVDRKWLGDIRKSPHLRCDGTFDTYDTALPFLQTAMMTQGYCFYLTLGKDVMLFLRRIIWLLACVAMLNDLNI